MKSKNAIAPDGQLRRETPHLDRRYGKIGISAVAAAVAYQSRAKNHASTVVPLSVAAQDRFVEMAA
jgi:hypothetical protein